MRLRTFIIVFLFMFALVPVVAVVLVNFPVVFDRLQTFYNRSHLQNLRADFRDLDQHLASRHEMIRVLARLPETPRLVIRDINTNPILPTPPNDAGPEAPSNLKPDAPNPLQLQAQQYFADWANQVLADQRDIIEIRFFDDLGVERFRLDREPQGPLRITPLVGEITTDPLIRSAIESQPGQVAISQLELAEELADSAPNRFMTLQLATPIAFVRSLPSGTPLTQAPIQRHLGAVSIRIDIAGIARAYPQNLWVKANGDYLRVPGMNNRVGSAFNDYPGLDAIFEREELDLWAADSEQWAMWVPMFKTSTDHTLWVGRPVDPSPISKFGDELRIRVAIVVALAGFFVWIIALWLAVRADRFGDSLTRVIREMLTSNKTPRFTWRGPTEVKALGETLSELAQRIGEHRQSLENHAHALEESNRYKSQFLANVSHELRTPLNSILLLSKLLSENREHGLSDTQVEQARVIHTAGSNLRSLIDNILDLSRIDSGKLSFHLEDVSLPALADQALTLIRPQFDAKSLDLSLDIQAGMTDTIYSDGEKLGQILRNFLSNALKFTTTGSVILRIREIDNQPDNQSCPIVIEVQDKGIGIPLNKQSAVFEAFQQADGSTNRRYGGTGLGLAISRELAQLLGGRIELHSVEAEGSTFSLHLPLRFDPSNIDQQLLSTETEATAAPSESEAMPIADYQQARILLVDDDLRNLLALTPILEGWNLQVLGAGDGEEALETLQDETDIKAVLLDMMMPEMDGFETLKQLRNLPELQNLPVAAVTALASDEDQQRCLAAGANFYLSKPIDPALLKSCLDQMLEAADPMADATANTTANTTKEQQAQ